MDPIDMQSKTSEIVKKSERFSVVDQNTYELASEHVKTLKTIISEISETFDPIIEIAHKAHKEALTQKAKFIAPLEQAKRLVDIKMSGWWRAEEARVEKERRRIEDEHRQEENRLRIIEEEKRLAKAVELEAQGKKKMADKEIAKPIIINPVNRPVMPTMTKVSGISYRDNWKAEVVDLKQLVNAVVAGTAPIALILPNEVLLNQQAKSFKDQMNIPGVKAVCEKIQSTRG